MKKRGSKPYGVLLFTALGAAVAGWSAPAAGVSSDIQGDLRATSGETVYFRGWQYKPDIVQDNTDRYNRTQDGRVSYQTVTGDYPALMEKSLIAGDRLDVIYANPSTAVRFMEAGWILPADELPGAEGARGDMYPNVRRAWTHKGKLLGLSYFLTIRGLTTVNTRRLGELGLSREDYPRSWDELYDQVDRLTRQGVRDVFLPHWFNEYYGISWAYVWEVLNRGGMLADPVTHEPRMTVEGPAGETLRDWKRFWNSGAIDEEILSYTESSLVEGFSSGRYLYSSQAHYNLAQFNDPRRSPIAGHVDLVPFAGSGWGLLDSALYLTTSQERDDELDRDVRRFVSWYGYRDDTGEIAVGTRWMETSMLFSAYRPVMESDAARRAMGRFLGSEGMVDDLLVLYANTPHPDGVWKVVWSEEFNAHLRKVLGNFLLRDEPVHEVVEGLTREIQRLNRKYGVS